MKNLPTFDEFIIESTNSLPINEGMKILSKEFGGYDDQDFLKKIWHMPLTELEDLLKIAEAELKRHISISPKKGVLSAIPRKEAEIAKGHIKFLVSVINNKRKNPDFVPDLYK